MLRFLVTTLLRISVCAGILCIAWLAGFIWFVMQVPTAPASDHFKTDAIVVLTGGKGRIDYGLKLLSEGRATRLFISGVEDGITPDQLVASHREAVRELDVHDNKTSVIMLGYVARNTIGNAMETAKWMNSEKLHSLRLVTTSYHMPRALSEFRFAMPGVTIVPDPVIPVNFRRSRWWTRDASSEILLREYHKYIAAALRHQLLEMTGDAE